MLLTKPYRILSFYNWQKQPKKNNTTQTALISHMFAERSYMSDIMQAMMPVQNYSNTIQTQTPNTFDDCYTLGLMMVNWAVKTIFLLKIVWSIKSIIYVSLFR